MIKEINMTEKVFGDLMKQTLSIYAVEKVAGNFIMGSDSMPVRNLKRASLWTLATELEKEVLYQNSDARQLNVMPLVEATLWNAVVSTGTEMSNLHVLVDNFAGNVVPPSDFRDAFTTAVILTGVKYFGGQFENQFKSAVSNLFETFF